MYDWYALVGRFSRQRKAAAAFCYSPLPCRRGFFFPVWFRRSHTPFFFSSFDALVGGSDLNLDIKNSFVQTLGREGSNGMFLISNASANTCLALSAAKPEWYSFVMCRVLGAHEVGSFNIATELRVEALVQMRLFTCISCSHVQMDASTAPLS